MGSSHKKKHSQRPSSDSGSGAPKSLESRSEIVPTPRRNLALEFRKPSSPVSKPSTESPAKGDRPTTGGKTAFSSKNPSTPKATPSTRPAVETESESDLFPDDEVAKVANKGPVSRGTKRKERAASVSSEASEASDSELGHLTKPTDSKRLGSVRDVPCSSCVRALLGDSFASRPHHCYDTMHETQVGKVNKLCSECARKHAKFCESIPDNLASEARKVYDTFDSEGRSERFVRLATRLIGKLPARRLTRSSKREPSVDSFEAGSPARPGPSFAGGSVPVSEYSAAISLLGTVNSDDSLSLELRNAVTGLIGQWVGMHRGA